MVRKHSRRYRGVGRAYNADDYALTILRARRFLADFPDAWIEWQYLGSALSEMSRYQEAEQALAKAIEYCPPEKRWLPYVAMGKRFQFARDHKQAATWFRKVIEGNPNYTTGYIYLGGVLATQGRLQQAEEVHREGTGCLEGCLDEAFCCLGEVLRAQERSAEAAECFREAIRRDPKYRRAKNALRDVSACLKELGQVEHQAHTLVRKQSRDVRWQGIMRADNAPGGGYALTILRARRYLADFPDGGPAWQYLGIALTAMARYEEAEQALAKAIEYCPPEVRYLPYSNMGSRFECAGDYAQAATWFQKVIEANPNDTTGYFHLGDVLAQQGRLQQAEEVHRTGTHCVEGFLDAAFFGLGKVLRAQERFAEAADCFREAIRRDPKYRLAKNALRDVSACLKELGRADPVAAPDQVALRVRVAGSPSRRPRQVCLMFSGGGCEAVDDEAGFLAALAVAPENLTVHRVYADWLDDRGDPGGEALRVWTELVRTPYEDASYRALFALAEQFRAALRAADPDWVQRVGKARPWVGARLASTLARLHLRVRHGRKADRQWLNRPVLAWPAWQVVYWRNRPGGPKAIRWRDCMSLTVDRITGEVREPVKPGRGG